MHKIVSRRLALILFIALLVLITAIITAEFFLNPWRKSNDVIRAQLLALTPLGTSRQEVETVLAQRDWLEGLPPNPGPILQGKLGGYQGLPWYTTAYGFWTFGSDDRLEEIQVHKFIDSP